MKRSALVARLLVGLLLMGGCAAAPISPPDMPSALEPHGPAAARLAELWWVMLALGTAMFLLVVVLMAAALLRRRRGSSETAPESKGGDTGRRWPIWGGIVLPLIVLSIVFGYSIYTLAAVDDLRRDSPVRIHVVGRRWFWEVEYPEQRITTANEIHIPVGVRANLELESADVIHSFWVPELHGKMDLIPTRLNKISIQADKERVYRGECAEFCGLQHAHMDVMVVAQSQAEYDAWIASQQQPAAAPSDPLAQRGQEVFASQGCVFCHVVRGLDDKKIDRSAVDLGPDLTHLASRLTIAAGTLTRNDGNLAGWVVDPQHVKPGAMMPNQNLSSEDLHALLAFLNTLR